MRSAKILIAALLGLAGCAGAPATSTTQDVEFLRGCWVQKDGPGGNIQAFLRLLSHRANGDDVYVGDVIDARNGGWRPSYRFAIAKNGSYLTFGRDPDPIIEGGARVRNWIEWPPTHMPLPQAENRAVWRLTPVAGREGWIVAQGTNDKLSIYLLGADSSKGEVMFDGERDGCD